MRARDVVVVVVLVLVLIRLVAGCRAVAAHASSNIRMVTAFTTVRVAQLLLLARLNDYSAVLVGQLLLLLRCFILVLTKAKGSRLDFVEN